MILEFHNRVADGKLIFDDNGKVAYAYLAIDGKIVSDVWLYNVNTTPVDPEWHDVSNAPFLNPGQFIFNERFKAARDATEISVVWETDEERILQVKVLIRDRLHAVLCPGKKPGWCRLSRRISPLARPLDESEEAPKR